MEEIPLGVTRKGLLGSAPHQGFNKYFSKVRTRVLCSSIALQEFDEQKYRDFVHTLSDQGLIKEGKKLRWLVGDGKIVSTMACAFG